MATLDEGRYYRYIIVSYIIAVVLTIIAVILSASIPAESAFPRSPVPVERQKQAKIEQR